MSVKCPIPPDAVRIWMPVRKQPGFEGEKMYVRYRFKTHSVDDPRPLIDMGKINMPWWCTGYAGDNTYAIIVCYLPKEHDKSIYHYWDDAFDIEKEEMKKITYTDRFPKPYWVD